MIELKGLAAYNRNFSHNSGANRKKDNDGPEFSLHNGGEPESSSGSENVREVEMKTVKVRMIEPETEVETYDFLGKILNSDILSGVNIDIVI